MKDKSWYKQWWGIILIIIGIIILFSGIKGLTNSQITSVSNTDAPTNNTNLSDTDYSVQNKVVKKEETLTSKEILELVYSKSIDTNDSKYCEDNRLDNNNIQFCKYLFAFDKKNIDVCSNLNISIISLINIFNQNGIEVDLNFLLDYNVSSKDYCLGMILQDTLDSESCFRIDTNFMKLVCLTSTIKSKENKKIEDANFQSPSSVVITNINNLVYSNVTNMINKYQLSNTYKTGYFKSFTDKRLKYYADYIISINKSNNLLYDKCISKFRIADCNTLISNFNPLNANAILDTKIIDVTEKIMDKNAEVTITYKTITDTDISLNKVKYFLIYENNAWKIYNYLDLIDNSTPSSDITQIKEPLDKDITDHTKRINRYIKRISIVESIDDMNLIDAEINIERVSIVVANLYPIRIKVTNYSSSEDLSSPKFDITVKKDNETICEGSAWLSNINKVKPGESITDEITLMGCMFTEDGDYVLTVDMLNSEYKMLYYDTDKFTVDYWDKFKIN